MLHKLAYLRQNPLLIFGALWPAILLVPHIPGIPRPSVDALPWRQELVLFVLLAVSLGLLLVQPFKLTSSISHSQKRHLLLCLLFVSWIWLSALWARDNYSSIHLAFQWSSYLLFFALMVMAPARVVRASIASLVVVVCILGLSSVIESWLGAPLTDGSLRVAAKPILRGSGTFGETMGVVAVLFSSFSLCARRRHYAILFGVAAVLSWLGTLQSLERAPFIATFVCLIIVLGAGLFEQRQYRKVALLGAVFFVACLIQLVPARQMAPEHASTVGRMKAATTGDSSAQARFLLWGIGLEMLRAHPLTGVGGNNYQANYAEARSQFASYHPRSALVGVNENLIPIYAHNEYVQMLAELGTVGFVLFALFAGSLAVNAWQSSKKAKRKLTVIGPVAALLAFAISSGASASSFRYLSGGLLFFFGAALITRTVSRSRIIPQPATELTALPRTRAIFAALSIAVLVGISLFSLQATGIVFQALAESSKDKAQREAYYQQSLRLFPPNTSAHFSYGMWLYGERRANEALPHVKRAVEAGLNNSVCYQYLAAIQEAAGNLSDAEQTLAKAVQVYPRSVFLLVRHSVSLERMGQKQEAEAEFSRALTIDVPEAKGWRNLIVEDIDAALAAAKADSDVVGPAELGPEAVVLAVLQENEIRNPGLINGGWRQRMRAAESNLK